MKLKQISILILFLSLGFADKTFLDKQWSLGTHLGSPATGYSIKYWPWSNLGLQLIGYNHESNGKLIRSSGGTRLLFKLADNSNEDNEKYAPFRFYFAVGRGQEYYVENESTYSSKRVREPTFFDILVTVLTLGLVDPTIEAVKIAYDYDHIIKSSEAVFGIESTAWIFTYDLEIGYEDVQHLKYKASEVIENNHTKGTKVSAGLHYYL